MNLTSSLGAGPTENGQQNSTGNTTVTPLSQNHTEIIEFSGSAGTRNVSVATTDLLPGAQITIVAKFVTGAANGIIVNVKNSNGTALFSFDREGDEANAVFRIRAKGWGGLEPIEQVIPAFPA